MLPSSEQESMWQSMAGFMPYNSSNVRYLRILEVDEMPPEDEQGKKKIDGFKVSWEGAVPAGELYSPPSWQQGTQSSFDRMGQWKWDDARGSGSLDS